MSAEKKEALRKKLSDTRRSLLSLLESLNESDWSKPVFSEDSDWTVLDLLRHLVDSERGMTGLMMQIRKGGEGVPADFDIDRWNARVIQKAEDKGAAELIDELETQSPALLQFVDSLTEADWGKKGRHASLRIMSIEEICHLIADHEQGHIKEIQLAVAG